jgi:hypothetical protein
MTLWSYVERLKALARQIPHTWAFFFKLNIHGTIRSYTRRLFMVSKKDLNPWASKVYPGEWDIGTNSNSTGFNFAFDPRFFHTAYEEIWHKTGMAWVVASNPVGGLWHVASSVGEGQDDLFFRTQKPIPASKIARWLILHGFDLYDSQWQRTVLPKDDDYRPPCPDADRKERPQPGEVYFGIDLLGSPSHDFRSFSTPENKSKLGT